eukprot:jgi/Mesvir1/16606/Mv10140-RA.1
MYTLERNMHKCRKEKAATASSEKALLDVLLSGMKQGWMASLDEEGNVVFAVPEEDDGHTDDESMGGDDHSHFGDNDRIFDLIAHLVSSSSKTPEPQGVDKVIQVGDRKIRLTVSLREEK